MDLEWFMSKVVEKQVKIESIHKGGILGIKLPIYIEKLEIQDSLWGGYILKVNDIFELYFEDWQVADSYECKHILALYRDDIETINIILPEEDSWN